MHYFADSGISGVPVSGLSGRIHGNVQLNYPDWFIQARTATRDHMRNTNMDATTALRFSVAAFKANWNRLGRQGADIADLTGWVKYTMTRGHLVAVFDPTQSVNGAVDNLIYYAMSRI